MELLKLLDLLEHSGFALTIKESATLYDIPLVLHAIGMGALVGLSAAVCLRILGFAPRLPLAPMEQYFPLMWLGFWINAASGVMLYVIYPVRATTNPGFYIKLGGVALAVVLLRKIRRQVFGNPASLDTRPTSPNDKVLAITTLFVWLVTVTAGRLMAYHGYSGIELPSILAVLFATIIMLAGFAVVRRLYSNEPSHVNASLAKGR